MHKGPAAPSHVSVDRPKQLKAHVGEFSEQIFAIETDAQLT